MRARRGQADLVRDGRGRYAEGMTLQFIIALLALALGAAVTAVNVRDGISFSFPLALGVLFIVDGVLRLITLVQEHGEEQA